MSIHLQPHYFERYCVNVSAAEAVWMKCNMSAAGRRSPLRTTDLLLLLELNQLLLVLVEMLELVELALLLQR